MEYVFYLDIFFLTNFYWNLLSLFLTAACLNRKCSFVRISFAAALGSFWNIVLTVFPFLSNKMELPITLILVGGVMLAIAFQNVFAEGFWQLMKAEGCLFLSAGLVSGCYSFSCQQFYLTDFEGLLCTGLICVLLERLIRKGIFHRQTIGDTRYQVALFYQGNVKQFVALADSGNRLCVPESGKPVSLISAKDCRGFCEKISGGFYIPYRAVGTENGMLFAVQFERMEIMKNGTIKKIERPVVAIVREHLSANGDFSMILPEAYISEVS